MKRPTPVKFTPPPTNAQVTDAQTSLVRARACLDLVGVLLPSGMDVPILLALASVAGQIDAAQTALREIGTDAKKPGGASHAR